MFGGGVGTPSTPSFFSSPATSASPFYSSSTPPMFQQQQQQPSSSPAFNFQTPSPQAFSSPAGQMITTQMAPIAPLPFSPADRDVQAIVDAYKDEPSNPKYAFKHLLFSVTDPSARVKPIGISDIMWAEAMTKLEGMESTDRERLWPQLVQGFKDLSNRLKLQDEAITSDTERLRTTQTNVKLLQRHFIADTQPWIQRIRQKEQDLKRRLLRVMRIVEAMENRGFRVPLTRNETLLSEKFAALSRQLKGPRAELPRRVQHLSTICRMQSDSNGTVGSIFLPGSAKIENGSLVDMQDVLQQQTEAIARLAVILKRDMRNMEIIMSEDAEMLDNTNA